MGMKASPDPPFPAQRNHPLRKGPRGWLMNSMAGLAKPTFWDERISLICSPI